MSSYHIGRLVKVHFKQISDDGLMLQLGVNKQMASICLMFSPNGRGKLTATQQQNFECPSSTVVGDVYKKRGRKKGIRWSCTIRHVPRTTVVLWSGDSELGAVHL